MSSLAVKVEEGGGAGVDLSDVVCPICLRLYIQPVQMPCRHVICLSCFNDNVAQATLTCPLCRTRISSWCRKAVISKTLVDQNLWSFVKKSFPKQVEARKAGLDEIDADEAFPCVPVHQFASVGDIKNEFETQLERVSEEEKQRREKEEELGSKLAEEIQAEERQRLREAEEQENSDREMARKMWREITTTPASSKKRKLSVIDLLKKSAEKKNKRAESPVSVEKPESLRSPDPEDPDVEMNFSDENFLEKQKLIESKLAQERADEEMARKLQSEVSQEILQKNIKEIQTPTTSKTPNGKTKPSHRQLSLMECSSKTSKVTEDCRLETPVTPKLIDNKDKENNKAGEENIPSQFKALRLFKQKIENDISIDVKLQPGDGDDEDAKRDKEILGAVTDQEALDAEFARKLQEEMDHESSPKSAPSDSRVVRNVFQVLSESQRTRPGSKCQQKHRNLPCKTCANCVRGNCGTCSSCRDMPQFGGRGLIKQSCVLRKCLRPTKAKCPSC